VLLLNECLLLFLFRYDSVRELLDTPSYLKAGLLHREIIYVNVRRMYTVGSGAESDIHLTPYRDLEPMRGGLVDTGAEYEGVSKRFRTESITKYTLTTINTR
jgi:hypothetical protein